MTGYRGESGWDDMSEYVVHFTRAAKPPEQNPDKPYWDHLSILWDQRLIPSDQRWGIARHDSRLGDSQRAVCFAEVPLPFVGRIADRRGSRYGIGFRQEFVRRQGAARVWYLDKDEPAATAFEQLLHEHRRSFDTDDPLWGLTPLIDRPGLYGSRPYRFEWEREWRLPGSHGLRFTTDDIAFLFIPQEWHLSARGFFDSYEPGTAPNPQCPFLDPHWDAARIAAALAGP